MDAAGVAFALADWEELLFVHLLETDAALVVGVEEDGLGLDDLQVGGGVFGYYHIVVGFWLSLYSFLTDYFTMSFFFDDFYP